MFAVYLSGPTDAFLQALFMYKDDAIDWVNSRKYQADFDIREWKTPDDIDRTDTGWQ
jgi:hypothetical protein